MAFIQIDEILLRKYIDFALKYEALIKYDVQSWCRYYDALDTFKDEDYDLENDDCSIIEDYSKLVDLEIDKILNYVK